MMRPSVAIFQFGHGEQRRIFETIRLSLQRVLGLEPTLSFQLGRLNLCLERAARSGQDCTVSFTISGEWDLSIERDPQSPQPLPVATSNPKLHDLLSSDILARKEHGARKYGQALQAENGRSFLLDIYEEILDAAVYLKGELEEREKLANVLEKLLNDLFNEDPHEDIVYLRGVIKRLRIK
jgi:hypothetical protein